jgi:hypothetical protein
MAYVTLELEDLRIVGYLMCKCFDEQIFRVLSCQGHILQGVGNSTTTYTLRPADGSKAPPYGGPRSAPGEQSMVHMLQRLSFSLASNVACHLATLHLVW